MPAPTLAALLFPKQVVIAAAALAAAVGGARFYSSQKAGREFRLALTAKLRAALLAPVTAGEREEIASAASDLEMRFFELAETSPENGRRTWLSPDVTSRIRDMAYLVIARQRGLLVKLADEGLTDQHGNLVFGDPAPGWRRGLTDIEKEAVADILNRPHGASGAEVSWAWRMIRLDIVHKREEEIASERAADAARMAAVSASVHAGTR